MAIQFMRRKQTETHRNMTHSRKSQEPQFRKANKKSQQKKQQMKPRNLNREAYLEMNGRLSRENRAEEGVAEEDPANLAAGPEDNEKDLGPWEGEECLARALLAQAAADAAAIFASFQGFELPKLGEMDEGGYGQTPRSHKRASVAFVRKRKAVRQVGPT